MAAWPGEPLGAGAFGEGFAVHAPAQVGAFGGKAHALAVGGNVGVEGDDRAAGGAGDARWRFL